MKCRVQEQPVQHSLSMCLARPDLCLGEVGGDAIDADAFGDGVKGVLQALALGFMPGVQDPPLDLVEQAGPRGSMSTTCITASTLCNSSRLRSGFRT